MAYLLAGVLRTLKSNIMEISISTLEQLIKEMQVEARAHNKYLTPEYLKSLEPRLLASLTPPDSRREYLDRLKLINNLMPPQMPFGQSPAGTTASR